jgi:hypothetical protein
MLVMQEDKGTSAEDFARVPNQPSWDQLVSVDRLAMSIDVETEVSGLRTRSSQHRFNHSKDPLPALGGGDQERS